MASTPGSRRPGATTARPGCSCTARRSRSTPSWSAPARKTALLITEGFRDIYEIGRINRPDAYNLFFQKHVPLVERALRFEVNERVLVRRRDRDGRSTTRRSRRSAQRWKGSASRLPRSCFSTATPGTTTRRARRRSWRRTIPNMFVSASHELSEEYREFERCSTVVANAYIGPDGARAMSARSTSTSAARVSPARS